MKIKVFCGDCGEEIILTEKKDMEVGHCFYCGGSAISTEALEA